MAGTADHWSSVGCMGTGVPDRHCLVYHRPDSHRPGRFSSTSGDVLGQPVALAVGDH